MSHHKDTCFQHGFLCTALNAIYRKVSVKQYVFLRQKIRSMLEGSAVLPMNIEGNPHLKYICNASMFAAMAHAYRLGIIDQWITNQKEK